MPKKKREVKEKKHKIFNFSIPENLKGILKNILVDSDLKIMKFINWMGKTTEGLIILAELQSIPNEKELSGIKNRLKKNKIICDCIVE